jgi:hypothetical protein
MHQSELSKREMRQVCGHREGAGVARKCTVFGEIMILQSRIEGSRIYCQEDWFQSEADRNGEGGRLGTLLSRAGREGAT